MAKKKRSSAITDALTSDAPEQSWKNQFSDSASLNESEMQSKRPQNKADGYKRKTYLMTEELINRIEAQAHAQQVGVNEMARYCLELALSQLESGEHSPEIQEVTISKRRLKL